jgi:hypothetical protein
MIPLGFDDLTLARRRFLIGETCLMIAGMFLLPVHTATVITSKNRGDTPMKTVKTKDGIDIFYKDLVMHGDKDLLAFIQS